MKILGIPHKIFIFIQVIAFFSVHFQCTHTHVADGSSQRRSYIVHVKSIPSANNSMSHREWHQSFIPPTSSNGLLYSFRHVMSGFAAMLTDEEVEALSKRDEFLHAQPSKIYQLDTSHTPKFLGLEVRNRHKHEHGHREFWRRTSGYGKGVIIGMIDGGISPKHPSFNDEGMPSPPKKWKGECEFKSAKLCNNKLIGARSFNHGDPSSSSPMDLDGHGTHTASIAAGRFIKNASVLGSAYGTASGMAPDAHLAIYNVCDESGCSSEDIMAGIESAIEDGVDVISISIGGLETSLYNDEISVASFRAVEKGIFVSASAGNDGPKLSTLENASPWIFTVGASTIDRKVLSIVKTNSGLKLQGESAYQPKHFTSSFLPLVYPKSENDENSTYCSNVTTLKTINVKGKIVLCDTGVVDREEAGSNVEKAGGVGMIYIGYRDDGIDIDATADMIPTSGINYKDGHKILYHYYNNPNVKAKIKFMGTQIGGRYNPAPAVASFSSRGPSIITPGFIKPDVIGPGVNILGAWFKPVGPFNVSPAFNMISGTSMSCPHLSGIAALLKSAHPDWSPTMIKSAIITTSNLTNTYGKKISDHYDNRIANFHAMGSGHVNPIKANNPGLVYDTQHTKDYVAYLCGLGYHDRKVSLFVPGSKCSKISKTLHGIDLNYPSMVVDLTHSSHYHRRFSRVVTNVGPSRKYNVFVSPPPGVVINIKPKTLKFKSIGKQLKFIVDVYLDVESSNFSTFVEDFGFFTWVSSNGKIKVRSSLVIRKENNVDERLEM